MPLIPPVSATGGLTRGLMTDDVELLDVAPFVTEFNETVYRVEDAVLSAVGRGSFQHYFSAEYDVDRDTFQHLGRIITDDISLLPSGKTFVRVNGGDLMEVDGQPQVWTLRGRHHIEFNVKYVVG